MHWKQREMLFEQREALKEQTGTARKRKSGTGKKGNEIARKGGYGTPMGGDTPKSPPGKSSKGRRFEGAHVNEQDGPPPRPAGPGGGGGPRPLPKKRRPDERIAGKKPEDKLARGRKLQKAKRQDEGKHLKKEGMHSKKEGMHSKKEGMHSKKKAESHCEAYAEAYVRGVEAALRESRR